MSTEQNKAIVRQLIDDVFNQGNLSRIDEIFAPDFVEHEEGPPGTPSGREGAAAMTTMLREAFPDLVVTIDDIFAEGDKVALRLNWSGTQQGPFMGLPPSGKRMSISVFDILRLDDGKIVEHWGLMDNMAMMQQLGAAPA